MRGFKKISVFVIFIFGLGTLCASIREIHPVQISENLNKEKYLNNQLIKLLNRENEPKVLIFGSSGILYGISAAGLKDKIKQTDFINLSMGQVSNKIDRYLNLILPKMQYGDVLILGERTYRSPTSGLLDQLPNIYFLPNFKNIFNLFTSPTSNRNESGDLLSYPSYTFNLLQGLKRYYERPKFDQKNIDLIKTRIESIKKSGGCPIIVFIPILINTADIDNYEEETKKLLDKIKYEGISKYVLNLSSLETDPTLFTDQYHLSPKGREKWTYEISQEILNRNICNLRNN